MRILSIDYGQKNIGLALSDPTNTIAYPYKTLDNKEGVLANIAKICRDEDVGQIVVGIPIGFSGETEQTMQARDFIKKLKNDLSIPIVEENEIFTTNIASARKLKSQDIDQQAAVVILEGYLRKTDINFKNIIQEFSEKLPKFFDGRIDYSNSDKAPVLTCFVKYQDQILLLKRSDKVRIYQGLWNTVAGYLDDLKPLKEKAFEEISEELGINRDNILKTILGASYEFHDKDAQKTWVIFPVLVELKNKPVIKLDWEHTEYKWIKPDDINNHDIVPNLDAALSRVL